MRYTYRCTAYMVYSAQCIYIVRVGVQQIQCWLIPIPYIVLAYMKYKAVISAISVLSWSVPSSWAFVGGLGMRMSMSATMEKSPTSTPTHPMTLTEKILAKSCGKEYVWPNENVWVHANALMTHDVCGPGTIGNFYKEFGPDAKVKFMYGCALMMILVLVCALLSFSRLGGFGHSVAKSLSSDACFLGGHPSLLTISTPSL